MAPVHIFYPFNYAPISNEIESCRPAYFMIYPKVAGEQVSDQAESCNRKKWRGVWRATAQALQIRGVFMDFSAIKNSLLILELHTITSIFYHFFFFLYFFFLDGTTVQCRPSPP
jgi:hypothetical protein